MSLQPQRVAALLLLLLLLLLEPEAWERDALPRAPRCLAVLVEWQHWLGQSAMRCPPPAPRRPRETIWEKPKGGAAETHSLPPGPAWVAVLPS